MVTLGTCPSAVPQPTANRGLFVMLLQQPSRQAGGGEGEAASSPLFHSEGYSPDGFPPCILLPGSEQVCLFQQCHFQAHETEMPNIQGMIEANKKWLESFKQDSKMYPFIGFSLLPRDRTSWGL